MFAARLALGTDNVGRVQEGRAIQTDLDERGLHPRQHPHHPTFVDIAHQTAAFGALDDDLVHHTVLHHGDPGLRRGDIDQDFFAHGVVSVGTCAVGTDARTAVLGMSSIPACPSSRPVSNSGNPMTPE